MTISISLPFGQSPIDLLNLVSDTIFIYQDKIESLVRIDHVNLANKISLNVSSDELLINQKKSASLEYQATQSVQTSQHLLLKLDFQKMKMAILHFQIIIDGLKKDQQITLIRKPLSSLTDQIQILEINHSSLSDGRSTGTENPNTLYLNTSFFSDLQSFFGQQNIEFNSDAAYNYTAIKIQNNSSSDQLILADMAILQDGRVATGFEPKDQLLTSYSSSSKSSIQIPAGHSTILTIPLYMNHLVAKPGEYQKKLNLTLFGYDKQFYQSDHTIYVNESNWYRFKIYLIFVSVGILGIVFFIYIYRHYIRFFPVAILITTAIFAAIHFAFMYLSFLLDSTFFAILGPFRTFISSLITEAISSSILISLLLVYPQKGVISIKLLISFLLSAVLTGSLYLHNIPALGLKVLLLESALTLSGFYRIESTIHKRFSVSLILGCVSAIMAYYSLLELQVLFRLFFADWYQVSFIFFTGFLYTFVAVFFKLEFRY